MLLDVNEGEGVELSDYYQVGTTYPVFILTDNIGQIISRWTGYTGGSQRFIATLKAKLRDLTTVNDRLDNFSKTPTLTDALILARYHADIRENLKAVEFFRQAGKLSPPGTYNYTYEIFANMANAAWNDKISFDEVLPSADAVLSAQPRNVNHVVKVATLITRLARKSGHTKDIAKYLQAGLDITKDSQKKSLIDSRRLFMADYTLHITGDTAKALKIKKAGMGENWENERDVFFEFAKWCLERKINLEEAEKLARRTISLVYPGKFRAKVYNTLSEISTAQGNHSQAVSMMKLAVQEEPGNDYYYNQLQKLKEKAGSGPR